MPATYAHDCFGKEVYKTLPAPVKDRILSHKELFLIGLHGPDILFYYKPLSKDPVKCIGNSIHDLPAADFFIPASKQLKAMKNQDGAFSYLFGFICHFALDCCCHPYIAIKEEEGLTHAEIEGEFDRFLMVRDGLEPLSHSQTCHIVPSRKNAEIISEFFPEINEDVMVKALRSFVFFSDLMTAPKEPKRTIIQTGLRLSGHYDSLHGHIINKVPNPQCEDSCHILFDLKKKALPLAKELICNYHDYLLGFCELDSHFQKTFGADK